jgi:hypothetical protein
MHEHQNENSVAAAIFANGTYFVDMPHTLVCFLLKSTVSTSKLVKYA